MSYQENKLMNLKDGRLLLETLDVAGRIAGSIAVTDSTEEAVKTLTDGADNLPMEVSVAINPVQDTHGFDPYPAGTSVNAMPNTLASTKTENGITVVSDGLGRYSIKGTASASVNIKFELTVPFTIPYSSTHKLCLMNTQANNNAYVRFMNGETQLDNWKLSPVSRVSEDYQAIGGQYCDNIRIVCSSGAVVDMTVSPMFVPLSASSTDFFPYSNICPISGWDSVQIARTGKNLFDKTGVTLLTGRYIKYDTGGVGSSANYSCTSTFIPCSNLRGKTISISPTTGVNSTPGVAFYESDELASFIIGYKTNAYNGITVPDNASYYRISIPADNNLNDIQVEFGSTATSYESFGNNYPISLPTTAYGGTLTVHKDGSGHLVADMGISSLDGLTWTYDSTNTIFKSNAVPNCKAGANNSSKIRAFCSMYSYKSFNVVAYGDSTVPGICIQFDSGNVGKLAVRHPAYTSVSDFVANLTGQTLVYELATPVSFDFMASQIRSLLGTNNVWADSGNVLNVVYYADTKMYIDAKIAELQALVLENT